MSAPASRTPDLTQLKRQAKELLQAFRAGQPRARERFGGVLPRLGGVSADRTVGFRAKLTDAQLVVAREHGFDSWPQLKAHAESGQGGPSPFLRAALAVVDGDLETLRALLDADPALIRARSPEPHRAQLLHYVAVNGVENHLQRTPANAVEVCRLLLDAGAEVDAPCQTYGGGPNQTTMNLLVSSVHPHRAGLQAALVECLLDGGAAVEGPLDDGAPLRTALSFGYTDTARTLERRGARVDALDLAAGLGRVELLAALWAETPAEAEPTEGAWRPARGGRFTAFVLACRNGQVEAALRLVELGVELDACPEDGGTGLHEAILWARADVVRALLARGADPAVRHGRWGSTALGLAAYNGHAACVEALLNHGAASAADLEQALVNAAGQGHTEVARRLLGAGGEPARARARAAEVGDADMVALLQA